MQIIDGAPASVVFSELGMVVEEDISYEEWEDAGDLIASAEFRSRMFFAWAWGDWLHYGAKQYGEVYAQAIHKTGLSYSTLQNYKWVAHKTPRQFRGLPGLSQRHYIEVAPVFDVSEKLDFLLKASIGGWTAKRLKVEVGIVEASEIAPPTLEDRYQESVEHSHVLEQSLQQQRMQTEMLLGQLQEFVEDVPDMPPITVYEYVEKIILLYRAERFKEMMEVIDQLEKEW
jgi:hypothetical protein